MKIACLGAIEWRITVIEALIHERMYFCLIDSICFDAEMRKSIRRNCLDLVDSNLCTITAFVMIDAIPTG